MIPRCARPGEALDVFPAARTFTLRSAVGRLHAVRPIRELVRRGEDLCDQEELEARAAAFQESVRFAKERCFAGECRSRDRCRPRLSLREAAMSESRVLFQFVVSPATNGSQRHGRDLPPDVLARSAKRAVRPTFLMHRQRGSGPVLRSRLVFERNAQVRDQRVVHLEASKWHVAGRAKTGSIAPQGHNRG
jgi:hypothetical protein